MKRLWIMLLAVAMAVVIALPAGASKPLKPGKPTAETPVCQTTKDFEIPKSGRVSYECLWTPKDLQSAHPVEGKVTVTPDDPISRLVVFVRDSSPGDICGDTPLSDPTESDSFVTSFDLSYGNLTEPDEWETDGDYPTFDLWEGKDYWDFRYDNGPKGEHWCYPQDSRQGMREDLNGTPLHLWVAFKGQKGSSVNVSLSPEQAPEPTE
jgi:hypothetical protein